MKPSTKITWTDDLREALFWIVDNRSSARVNWSQVAEEFRHQTGLVAHSEALRAQYRQRGASTAGKADPGEILQRDSKIVVLQAKLKGCQKQYAQALVAIRELDEHINVITQIDTPRDFPRITGYDSDLANEACVIGVISDIHAGLVIEPETVGYKNKYDPDICRSRMREAFRNMLKLVNMERSIVQVNHMVLAILGDLISGELHEELLEGNVLSPGEACELVEDELIAGIDYLLADGGFKDVIRIVCEVGNHDRETDRRRFSTGNRHSYATTLYRHLARHYKNDDRVVFMITQGYDDIIDIYGCKVRLHHGDAIRGGGGIGGLVAPIKRWIARQEPVDLDVMAHLHTYIEDRDFVLCGSLCGYDAYAKNAASAPFCPPSQTVIFIDKKKKRKTLARQVYVE